MKAFLIFEFRFASSIKPTFPLLCLLHPNSLVNSFSPSFALQKPAKDLLWVGSPAPWPLPLQDSLLPAVSTLGPQMQDVTSFKNLSESGGGGPGVGA